jgi:hypothetical protein
MNEPTLRELTTARLLARQNEAGLERVARRLGRPSKRRPWRSWDVSSFLYVATARRDATP